MAATQRFLSGTSGFLPQSTGQIIGFIRTPKKFRINKYAQNVKTPAPDAAYAYLDTDQPVRIYNLSEFAFVDGAERPTGNANQMAYSWVPFRTERTDIPCTIGNQAIETTKEFSGWDPAQVAMAQTASQMMTFRTMEAMNLLQTAANWGSNTADANTINGGAGTWANASSDSASPFFLAIKKTFTFVQQVIHLGTNAVVEPGDIRCVVSPQLAEVMSNTDEIYNYVKYGPYAEPRQSGEGLDYTDTFGLPKHLYGVEMVVENAPFVNVQPNASGILASITSNQRQFAKNNTSAIFMSRIGGIDAPYGGPSFSTLQIYFYQFEMSAWQYADQRNLREEFHIMEQRKVVLAAPVSGFLVTNCQ